MGFRLTEFASLVTCQKPLKTVPLRAYTLRIFIVSSIRRLILATLAFSPLLSQASDLPRLEPEPGLFAQVEQEGDRYQLLQPDGSRIDLLLPESDLEQGPSFEVADYNFDGHADLAIRLPAGMVNENYSLYLYDPATRRYALLTLPEALSDALNCGELLGLHANVEEHALYSSCRSGPRWYYDALRFDEQGKPWLYKALHVQEDNSQDYPYLDFQLFEKTFDAAGNEVASRAVDDDNQTQIWTVPTARVDLYQQPNLDSRTKAYLIQGDTSEVLARKGQWLQIRYASSKGPLERWVSLAQAYDLHQRYSAAPHLDGLSLSLSDFSDPDSPLFNLSLEADRSLTLEHAEVHLLFTAEDGTQYSHRLYAANYPIELSASEGHLLDDNFIERRDGQFVIYHVDENEQDDYVPFFPKLAPGHYRVRVALTDPSLSAPLYSDDEVLIDYPPIIIEASHSSPPSAP